MEAIHPDKYNISITRESNSDMYKIEYMEHFDKNNPTHTAAVKSNPIIMKGMINILNQKLGYNAVFHCENDGFSVGFTLIAKFDVICDMVTGEFITFSRMSNITINKIFTSAAIAICVTEAEEQMKISDTEKEPPSKQEEPTSEQKELVLSLDVNNSEHVKQYSIAIGVSEKAAKEMLVIHQNDIMNVKRINMHSNQEIISKVGE